jgi:hypothetical protein
MGMTNIGRRFLRWFFNGLALWVRWLRGLNRLRTTTTLFYGAFLHIRFLTVSFLLRFRLVRRCSTVGVRTDG